MNFARSTRGDLPHGSWRCPLFIRDEARNVFLIHIGNHGTATQVTFTFAGFTGQDVARKGATALDSAGR